MSIRVLAAAALTALVALPAQAAIDVVFVESAPKDRFVVSNTGNCMLDNVVVAIELTGSAGGLIFDTTGNGAGVEVFQPFEVRSGDVSLISNGTVNDGDTALSVRISQLGAGESASFTIDVDDTLTNSALGQIRVAGAEIEGATVEISQGGSAAQLGRFGSDSTAQINLTDC